MSAPDAGGNGYKHCQSGAQLCLGETDGNSMDWVYGELGAASFTTEIEGNSSRRRTNKRHRLENNRQGLIYMAKLARTPYLTTRGPDVNNLAVQPAVVNAGSQPRLTAAINYSWEGNNYSQNVGGAEYYIDKPPAGGTPLTMTFRRWQARLAHRSVAGVHHYARHERGKAHRLRAREGRAKL